MALVSYAKERGVRVIPELDVPGHAGGLHLNVLRNAHGVLGNGP